MTIATSHFPDTYWHYCQFPAFQTSSRLMPSLVGTFLFIFGLHAFIPRSMDDSIGSLRNSN